MECKRNPSRWSGRSDTSKVVLFPPTANLEPGDLVTVKVERTTSHSLFGEMVDFVDKVDPVDGTSPVR